MAVEYYRLALSGYLSGNETEHELLKLMFDVSNLQSNIRHQRLGKWKDLSDWLQQYTSQLRENKNFLIEGMRTYMGVIGDSRGGSVHLYNTAIIRETIRQLKKDDWVPIEVLSAKLPDGIPATNFLGISYNLIKGLMERLGTALKADDGISGAIDQAKSCIDSLKAFLGDSLDEAQFQRVGWAAEGFLTLLSERNIVYQGVSRQDVVAIHESARLLSERCDIALASFQEKSIGKLLATYSANPCYKLLEVIRALGVIEQLAEKHATDMERRLEQLASKLPNLPDENHLFDQIDALEARIERLGGEPDASEND